jgi:predicted dehydrogenase
MKLKIGFAGFAHVHAPGHAEYLRSRNDVDVVGIFDENRDRGLYYANKYGFEYVESLERLVRREPDLVVIDSETVKHLEYVKILAESGIHIFCEKPIGINIQMAREIKNYVEKHGILFTTGFGHRFNPDIVKLREILQSNEIGEIYVARVRIAHSGAIDKWFKDWSLWFAVKELAGGGGLLDLGIHAADLLRYILNDEAVEVWGIDLNLAKTYDIDDFGIAVITFSKQTVAVLESGWVQVAENPSLSPDIQVYGGKGTALKTFMGTIYYSRDRNAWIKPNPPQIFIRHPLEDIIEAIKMGRKPTITVDDAVKAQEIIEATYISSAEKKPIKLPLP